MRKDGAFRQDAAKARGGPPPLPTRSASAPARNKKRAGDRADKALNGSPNERVSPEGRSPPPEAGRHRPFARTAVLANDLWRLLDFKFVSRLAPPSKQ